MKRKKAMPPKVRAWQVHQRPEDLPESAHYAWPDLAISPTTVAVRSFRKATKRDRETALAVLSGLRRFAESSSQFVLSYAAFFLSLLAIILATNASSPWFPLIGIVIGAGAFLCLVLFIPMAAALEERRKAAILWLRALEEPTG